MMLLWWGCQAREVGEQLGDATSETKISIDSALVISHYSYRIFQRDIHKDISKTAYEQIPGSARMNLYLISQTKKRKEVVIQAW